LWVKARILRSESIKSLRGTLEKARLPSRLLEV
jgi:hypothetical protein